MIEKYMRQKVFPEVWYIGTIYILTTPVVVDSQKQYRRYATGRDLSRNSSCMIIRARYVNSSKIENTLHVRLPPKKIAELNLWNTIHVELIGLYRKSIRQHKIGGTTPVYITSVIHNKRELTILRIQTAYIFITL